MKWGGGDSLQKGMSERKKTSASNNHPFKQNVEGKQKWHSETPSCSARKHSHQLFRGGIKILCLLPLKCHDCFRGERSCRTSTIKPLTRSSRRKGWKEPCSAAESSKGFMDRGYSLFCWMICYFSTSKSNHKTPMLC